MKNKIYRGAIINKYDKVIYLSDIFFLNRETAIKKIKNDRFYPIEEEEIENKIKKVRLIKSQIEEVWKTFEVIKKYKKEKYIGIITETLIVDEKTPELTGNQANLQYRKLLKNAGIEHIVKE